MILSKRESLIAVLTAAAIGLLVFDRVLLTPFLNRRAQVEDARQSVLEDMDQASALFARRSVMGRKWKEMLDGGLKADPAETEGLTLHALRDWAQEADLTLASIKPERLPQTGDLREIMFQAVGNGRMSAVARFLWLLETTDMPLRIKELQLGSRKDGTDDLALTLRISALYLAPEAEGEAKSGGRS